MSNKLTKLAYEKLVEQDLEWLSKQPNTLERQHVECIVREATYFSFGLIENLRKIRSGSNTGEILEGLQELIDDLEEP